MSVAKSVAEFVVIIAGVKRFLPSTERIAAHCILIKLGSHPTRITFNIYLSLSSVFTKKFKSNSPSSFSSEALISKFSYNFFAQ